MKNQLVLLFFSSIFILQVCTYTSCTLDSTKYKIEETQNNSEKISMNTLDETSIKCTCTDSDGKKYSATKKCKVDGYCDCSSAKKPKVVCCSKPCDE